MSMSEGDRVRLLDALDFIEEITSYTAPGERDQKTERAVTYLIAMIGESFNHLSPETKQLSTDIDWGRVIGMRHRLIHDYGHINVKLLWNVVDHELPRLKQHIETILNV